MAKTQQFLLQLIVILYSSLYCVLAELEIHELLRATRARCSTSRECTENAYCWMPQGFCTCNLGYVFVEDNCVAVAVSLGDACIVDIQCEIAFGTDAECISSVTGGGGGGQCQCQLGSHFAENKCHKSTPLESACKTRSDCYTSSGTNVYCVHSVCTCHQDYHPNNDKNDCLLSRALGESCRNDDDCVANDALCYKTCSCQAGFVTSTDNTRCLSVAYQLGDSCELDTQCLQFLPLSTCRSQHCSCMEGSHELENKCWRTSELGEPCEDWRQCTTVSNLTGSVTCDNNKRCRCTSGFTINSNRDDCRYNNSSRILQTSLSYPLLLILFTLLFTS